MWKKFQKNRWQQQQPLTMKLKTKISLIFSSHLAYHSNKVVVVGVEENDAQREIDQRGDNGTDGAPQQRQGHHCVDNEHQQQRVPNGTAVVVQLGHILLVQLKAKANLTCKRNWGLKN